MYMKTLKLFLVGTYREAKCRYVNKYIEGVGGSDQYGYPSSQIALKLSNSLEDCVEWCKHFKGCRAAVYRDGEEHSYCSIYHECSIVPADGHTTVVIRPFDAYY